MIQINEKKNMFFIVTDNMSYVFQIEKNSPRGIYFGGPIDMADAEEIIFPKASQSSFDDDIRSERDEYYMWNGVGYHNPALRGEGDNGRALYPVYAGYEIKNLTDKEELVLSFKDETMGVDIKLHYILFPSMDIIERKTSLTADKDISFTKISSGTFSLPHFQEAKARYVTGKWNGEFKIVESPVNSGMLTLQSKRGIPGPHFNPSIALAEPSATETQGNVWFGALGYSGNWAIEVERTIFGNTHITAGINTFDFDLKLTAGDTFKTPSFYIGFTSGGFGEQSRLMHTFVRSNILPKEELRPVLYNSWEATYFDVTAKGQMQLATLAAKVGCELFVVDDGWFGERHSDKAGLGDWWVNPDKFPNGLDELISHVTKLGMRFGIWVEPESVNPDSDLYRAHPDWIYRHPYQEPVQLRNQYLLNLSLKPVQEYLRKVLHDLLADNPDITFIKWDMNRTITEPSSVASNHGKSIWHNHVTALYDLWRYVRENFPHVEMETCSGGGGRIDLGILRYAEQTWPSDNTDPYTRLFIQEGFSQFYPACAMMSWVTDSPGDAFSDRPIRYRMHSSMCGGLAIGADITKYTKQELDEVEKYVSDYKKIRHIVQRGRLYRLLSPREDKVSAVQYVSDDMDESVVFFFANGITTDKEFAPIKLQGLDGNAKYKMDEGRVFSGKTLMNSGVYHGLWGDFASRMIHLVRNK